MIIMSRAPSRRILHHAQGVSTFVTQAGRAAVGIDWFSGLIEIFGAYMERLVNVADTMRQQNHRNRFGNLARVIRGNFAAQDANAVRDCVYHIPVATAGFAITIFLGIKHRHIGVMHPTMGRRLIIRVRAWWVRLPKIVQLLLDFWMREKMNSTTIIGAVLVPTLDVVRN